LSPYHFFPTPNINVERNPGTLLAVIFEHRMLNFHKSHASRQQDDTYLMKKHYLCSPIMGERLRIPVDEYGIAVSLAGHGGS
jgi:phenylalanyl-tRNA synthetase alpha subunit